jgi:DNA-binding PadR family transcriptional regulator
MNTKLKRALLLALLACDGLPMPQAALFSAGALQMRPAIPTLGDIDCALKDLEAEGYVAGVTEELTGVSWSLTTKGLHAARGLRGHA